MKEKTKSIIGWILLIIGLIVFNYYEYVRWCDSWFYFNKPWCQEIYMNNWVNWVIFGCLAIVIFIYVVKLAYS